MYDASERGIAIYNMIFYSILGLSWDPSSLSFGHLDRHFPENILFGQANISLKNFQFRLSWEISFPSNISSTAWLKYKLPSFTHRLLNLVGIMKFWNCCFEPLVLKSWLRP